MKWNGYIRVIGQAKDGLEAVEQALNQNPDVILMDVEMPHMNGLEATHAIHHKNSTIKIIMLSSVNKSTCIQQAMQLGASDYLIKGSTPDEIIETILAVTREGDTFQPSAPLYSFSLPNKYQL